MQSSNWSEESSRLYRVRKTVLQMLQDRGFRVLPEDLEEDLASFSRRYGDTPNREALTLLHSHTVEDKQIFVFFPLDAKLSLKSLRDYAKKMQTENVKHSILVLKDAITSSAKNAINTFSERIEVFFENQLLINITEHELVPKHTPLTPQQKAELLQRYKLKETQLPRILVDDPVARHFGLVRGDVVRIVRNSETAGEYVTYRLAC
ncbi:hypothetical protein RCL1_001828 [Eukaryota sp. TZLM3-RCL]